VRKVVTLLRDERAAEPVRSDEEAVAERRSGYWRRSLAGLAVAVLFSSGVAVGAAFEHRHSGRPPATTAESAGNVLFSIETTHPTWGHITVAAWRDAPAGQGHIRAYDETGMVRWSYDTSNLPGMDEFNPEGVDRAGNIFLHYNPGRYPGVIVLRPTPAGFEDFGSLPTREDGMGVWYSATDADIDGDGVYEIVEDANDRDPACAGGTFHRTIYRWDGSTFRGTGAGTTDHPFSP
jgi:hypothetical protein